jgi:hypothetical protein
MVLIAYLRRVDTNSYNNQHTTSCQSDLRGTHVFSLRHFPYHVQSVSLLFEPAGRWLSLQPLICLLVHVMVDRNSAADLSSR